MKKKFRPMLSFILVLAMCVSISAPVFAKETVPSDEDWETVYVELEDGLVIAVKIRESGTIGGGIMPTSLDPEYPVGTTRSYEVEISNEQLLAPGVMMGTVLSLSEKTVLAQAIAAAVNTKLGAAVITISMILAVIGGFNIIVGNDGFKIKVDLEYFATYINSQGHYLYGWDVTDVTISTY